MAVVSVFWAILTFVRHAPMSTQLIDRGGELFHAGDGCWLCHGKTGEGTVGPSLHFGPTPVDIYDQLQTNPLHEVSVQVQNPSDEDLVALAMYIRQLAGMPVSDTLSAEYRRALAAAKVAGGNADADDQ